MILNIDVEERTTGALVLGGGYSNAENFFSMVQIAERNLFGLGQTLSLRGKFSSTTNKYTLSFTEPWLFDIPLSAGFDLYNWLTEYSTYDKESKGGGIRFGYSVFPDTRGYISYNYDISNIEIEDMENAPDSIKDIQGENITSSIKTSLVYDSRNRFFNPTKGANHLISLKYAGIGGNIGYTRAVAESGVYIPMLWDFVGFIHAETGYIWRNRDFKLPDYELFYLGGINSVRGFDWLDIHCQDENGEEIGGRKFVQGNFEILYPLFKNSGLMGLIFFDTGNVYNKDEHIKLGELRESAGFGIRWYSPLGPIRLERGYILDPKENEDNSGTWQFTIGYAF